MTRYEGASRLTEGLSVLAGLVVFSKDGRAQFGWRDLQLAASTPRPTAITSSTRSEPLRFITTSSTRWKTSHICFPTALRLGLKDAVTRGSVATSPFTAKPKQPLAARSRSISNDSTSNTR